MAERSLQTVTDKIQPKDPIGYLATQLGEQECCKYIRSMLVPVEQVLGEVVGLNEVVPFIRETYWDFNTEDLAKITKKLLTFDIYGKPNARHVMKAAELVAEDKAEEREANHNKRKWEHAQPMNDPKLLEVVKSVVKPINMNVPKIKPEELLTLEELSGLSEHEKKNRKWAREWFTERAAWAKETGNKIEDYPVTMESFIEARWVELDKLAD